MSSLGLPTNGPGPQIQRVANAMIVLGTALGVAAGSVMAYWIGQRRITELGHEMYIVDAAVAGSLVLLVGGYWLRQRAPR